MSCMLLPIALQEANNFLTDHFSKAVSFNYSLLIKFGIMRKHMLLFLSMLISSCFIYAQENTTLDETWKLSISKNGVFFYYKIIKCDGVDAVLLGFKNTNTAALTVLWEEELTIDNVVRRKEDRIRTLIIPPGELVQSDCTKTKIPIMLVPITNYSENYSILNSYQYQNVHVLLN